jgi:8-oxo-dGTP pyrophosphatase MutT (NUDIX family)
MNSPESKELKPVHTVGVLLIKDDRVLLVRHSEKAGHLTGTYGLPAGRVEEGSGEKDTAIRELKEETGLVVNKGLLRELPTRYRCIIKRKDGEIDMTYKVYKCDSFEGDITPSEEGIPEWVDISKLSEVNLLPNVNSAIEEGLAVNSS